VWALGSVLALVWGSASVLEWVLLSELALASPQN
jgi:hypothetical protein